MVRSRWAPLRWQHAGAKEMSLKLLGSAVAALAILAFTAASEPAHARGHGGHGGGHGHVGARMGGGAPSSGVRHFSAPRHFAPHHFRHHRRSVVVGAYPYYYA